MGEPLLFIKYNRSYLNILDAEKKVLHLKTSIQVEQEDEGKHHDLFDREFIANNYFCFIYSLKFL